MKSAVRISLLVIVLGTWLTGPVWGTNKKIVRIWHTETEPQSVKAFQQIIDDFEKLHPAITVKQEALPWGDLEVRLTAALAAGAPPDASHGQALTCASMQAKGLLRPLEDLADAVRGMPSQQAAAKAQARAEELITGLGHKRW